MSFIVLIDKNNWGDPKVLREDGGEAIRFESRDDAWQGALDELPAQLFTNEQLGDCECEDGGESCPPCGLEGHIRSFIADHRDDEEFVSEYLPAEVVRVQVQPTGHYHVYRGDFEDGAGNPIIGLEDALQTVSELVDRLADDWSQMASIHGSDGDYLKGDENKHLSEHEYAQAWLYSQEVGRLDAISQSFDLAARREAPLFQGDGGAECWQSTLKHLMSTYLHMSSATDSGVIETQVGSGSVCLHYHSIPECWEEQEF